MVRTVEMMSGMARRLAALVCLVVPVALGGCGLTTKSYSMFDNYKATDQERMVVKAHTEQEEALISKSLESQGRAAESSAQALWPTPSASAPTLAVQTQPNPALTPVPEAAYSPLALADMRDQLAQQAVDLLKQAGPRPCDPYTGIDANRPAPAEGCAPAAAQ